MGKITRNKKSSIKTKPKHDPVVVVLNGKDTKVRKHSVLLKSVVKNTQANVRRLDAIVDQTKSVVESHTLLLSEKTFKINDLSARCSATLASLDFVNDKIEDCNRQINNLSIKCINNNKTNDNKFEESTHKITSLEKSIKQQKTINTALIMCIILCLIKTLY